MTVTHVKAHTRGKEDPFKPVMEARKARFCRKWLVEPANTDDASLSRPVGPPEAGGPSQASIIEGLRNLAKLMRNIGRS